MKKYIFQAKMIENDNRTGFKKGYYWTPKGFYYNQNNIIIVGDVNKNSTTRISFPINYVDITVEVE